MRAFRKWMRVVLPREGLVYAYLILCAIVSAICYGIVRYTPSSMYQNPSSMVTREIVVIGGAIVYGIVRGVCFHPLYNDDYLKLLKRSAWAPKKPLPFGPVHLVWQDAVVMAALTLMITFLPMVHPSRICTLALMGYLLTVLKPFSQFSMWSYYCGVIFGTGLAVFFWSDALLALGVILVTYYISIRGLRPSFEKLHETALDQLTRRTEQNRSSNRPKGIEQRYGRLAGWPYDAIAPRLPSLQYFNRDIYGISARQGWIISLLVGWWVFAIIVCIFDVLQSMATLEIDAPDNTFTVVPRALKVVLNEIRTPTSRFVNKEAAGAVSMGVVVAMFSLSIGRLTNYIAGHRPPFDFFGRWVTGQWLIPAYDNVFIAPLCVVLVAAILYPLLVFSLGLSPMFAAPPVISLMVLCVMNIGPPCVEWLLTAPCQLTPPIEYRNRTSGEFSDS